MRRYKSISDYKSYVHVLNLVSDLAWPKWMEIPREQKYMLSGLHSLYHVCWCPGDFRGQVSRGMVFAPKVGIFHLQDQKSHKGVTQISRHGYTMKNIHWNWVLYSLKTRCIWLKFVRIPLFTYQLTEVIFFQVLIIILRGVDNLLFKKCCM